MAPILLKIKGTKIFSPFSKIDDVDDLSSIWRVCTKVKDSLENGERLENLSWRLWHLHQLLEQRGHGRNYRKLSPQTTSQLESADHRMAAQKLTAPPPMHIKVRLGKTAQDEHRGHEHGPRPGGSAATVSPAKAPQKAATVGGQRQTSGTVESKNQSQGLSNVTDVVHGTGVGAGAAKANNQPATVLGQQQSAANSIATGKSQQNAKAAAAVGADGWPASAGPQGIAQNIAAVNSTAQQPLQDGSNAAVTGGTPLGGFSANLYNQTNQMSPTNITSFTQTQPTLPTTSNMSGEVHASDLMSLGQSSFLGTDGFELDPPQIEITLDDIFATSNGWDGGFGGFPMQMNNHNSGTMGFMPNFNAGGPASMWPHGGINGFGGHGGLSALFGSSNNYSVSPRNGPLHASSEQTSPVQGKPDGPICANCGVTQTPLWRRSINDKTLCNACGLYYKLHNTDRPRTLRPHITRKDSRQDDPNSRLECSNCQTTQTPLWRRDEEGNILCNACGLYYKLHKSKRPLSLKTGIIRKRQRYDNKNGAGGRKRKDDQSEDPGDGGGGSGGTGGTGINDGGNSSGDSASTSSNTGSGGPKSSNNGGGLGFGVSDVNSYGFDSTTENGKSAEGAVRNRSSTQQVANLHVLTGSNQENSKGLVQRRNTLSSAPVSILPHPPSGSSFAESNKNTVNTSSISPYYSAPIAQKTIAIASAINIPISPISTPKTSTTSNFSGSPAPDSSNMPDSFSSHISPTANTSYLSP
ncbi:hypothetical protein H4219_000162 [Mycoemilia scoparia]|uniref:GATA-type domain-containing protein n=1 Tax=Mycoemilia scoparia TaxID=417184 RepID=A0A9W8DXE7_9FUNG|nr:hypothetical protein H4219_000162 [Mycoemilia scoparia]